MSTISPTSSWFTYPRPHPDAVMRLFCFPYAGGLAQMFHIWPEGLAPTVEICAVQLPGHGSCLREAPFTPLTLLSIALVSIHHRKAISLSFRICFKELLPSLTRPSVKSPPKTFPQIAYEMLKLFPSKIWGVLILTGCNSKSFPTEDHRANQIFESRTSFRIAGLQ